MGSNMPTWRTINKVYLFIFLLIFFSLFSANTVLCENNSCQCEFDTDEYQAIGYFAGTCSYTMDETRKKCELRRSYDYADVKESLLRLDLFWDPFEIGKAINYAAVQLYDNPELLIQMAPEKVFPFLMRASYLAAPFLSDHQKASIDDILISIIKKHGKEMLYIFSGLDKASKEKTFQEDGQMHITKGSIKLTLKIEGVRILVCTKVLPMHKWMRTR